MRAAAVSALVLGAALDAAHAQTGSSPLAACQAAGPIPPQCTACEGFCSERCMSLTSFGQIEMVDLEVDPACEGCAGCVNCGPWSACFGISDTGTVEQNDCYMHLERDMTPCNDGDDSNNREGVGTSDQCFQGACGSWQRIETVINSEAERQQWLQHAGIEATDCNECTGEFPYYLALTGSGGHGPLSSTAVFSSFMAWKHPDIPYTAYSSTIDPSGNQGNMPGRALFISKNNACGNQGQWGDAGAGGHGALNNGCSGADNAIRIRSETQAENLDGWAWIYVFVPAHEVTITNVVTHSSANYVAAPVALYQPYYVDRMYAITSIPDFLRGLHGIRTANNDKHSDPTDLEWLCFDIEKRAAVYVLYVRQPLPALCAPLSLAVLHSLVIHPLRRTSAPTTSRHGSNPPSPT